MTRLLLLLSVVILAACGDTGPISGPGTLTATLVTPRDGEGSALIALVGEGIGAVRPSGDGWVFSESAGDTTRVVVVGDASSSLRFLVELADTTARPAAVVMQVAGPNDALRRGLHRYSLEFGR